MHKIYKYSQKQFSNFYDGAIHNSSFWKFQTSTEKKSDLRDPFVDPRFDLLAVIIRLSSSMHMQSSTYPQVIVTRLEQALKWPRVNGFGDLQVAAAPTTTTTTGLLLITMHFCCEFVCERGDE